MGGGRRAPPPWRLWKQKQWEEEECHCPLHRDYGHRNNGRRNDAIAPSIEIVETETIGGAQEGERPLQRGYENRNNGRSSGGRAPPPKRLWKQKQWEEFMRESAPSSPGRLWKRKQWEEGGLPFHSNCLNGN